MRRKTAPASWVRRMTHPVREFLRLDVHMTEQVLRSSPRSTQRFMCAPSRFGIWVLDELEHTAADLKSLFRLRRAETPVDPPR